MNLQGLLEDPLLLHTRYWPVSPPFSWTTLFLWDSSFADSRNDPRPVDITLARIGNCLEKELNKAHYSGVNCFGQPY